MAKGLIYVQDIQLPTNIPPSSIDLNLFNTNLSSLIVKLNATICSIILFLTPYYDESLLDFIKKRFTIDCTKLNSLQLIKENDL